METRRKINRDVNKEPAKVDREEYKKCLDQLKKKVEEVEIHKSKIEDLQIIVDSKTVTKETVLCEKEALVSAIEKPKPHIVSPEFKTTKREFNCVDCDFQGDTV